MDFDKVLDKAVDLIQGVNDKIRKEAEGKEKPRENKKRSLISRHKRRR